MRKSGWFRIQVKDPDGIWTGLVHTFGTEAEALAWADQNEESRYPRWKMGQTWRVVNQRLNPG